MHLCVLYSLEGSLLLFWVHSLYQKTIFYHMRWGGVDMMGLRGVHRR